jgi:hypothetical protein
MEGNAMSARVIAMTAIYLCTSFAWVILGSVTEHRTETQDRALKRAVGELWGLPQQQSAPQIYYQTWEEKKVEETVGSKTTVETRRVSEDHPLVLDGSDIDVDLALEPRKKGLLWYSTYRVRFRGVYTIVNAAEEPRGIFFRYDFPSREGIYDDFVFKINGMKETDVSPEKGGLLKQLAFAPGEMKKVEIGYASQGMDAWWYSFGANVSQIRNFKLKMNTDFHQIDFPENGISPTRKVKSEKGWELLWEYSSLVSGIQIGMGMPGKINPGPFVSRVTFFAPVSLLLFMFVMLIITVRKEIRIHPMNYFFISSAFFSFHLLMAYLADHVNIHVAFLVSAAVSTALVISYVRLVVGSGFALLETGGAQLVYLILFSYSFFLEGYTGLTITACCILTLFVVMQITGRTDWEVLFSKTRPE